MREVRSASGPVGSMAGEQALDGCQDKEEQVALQGFRGRCRIPCQWEVGEVPSVMSCRAWCECVGTASTASIPVHGRLRPVELWRLGSVRRSYA